MHGGRAPVAVPSAIAAAILSRVRSARAVPSMSAAVIRAPRVAGSTQADDAPRRNSLVVHHLRRSCVHGSNGASFNNVNVALPEPPVGGQYAAGPHLWTRWSDVGRDGPRRRRSHGEQTD